MNSKILKTRRSSIVDANLKRFQLFLSPPQFNTNPAISIAKPSMSSQAKLVASSKAEAGNVVQAADTNFLTDHKIIVGTGIAIGALALGIFASRATKIFKFGANLVAHGAESLAGANASKYQKLVSFFEQGGEGALSAKFRELKNAYSDAKLGYGQMMNRAFGGDEGPGGLSFSKFFGYSVPSQSFEASKSGNQILMMVGDNKNSARNAAISASKRMNAAKNEALEVLPHIDFEKMLNANVRIRFNGLADAILAHHKKRVSPDEIEFLEKLKIDVIQNFKATKVTMQAKTAFHNFVIAARQLDEPAEPKFVLKHLPELLKRIVEMQQAISNNTFKKSHIENVWTELKNLEGRPLDKATSKQVEILIAYVNKQEARFLDLRQALGNTPSKKIYRKTPSRNGLI